MGYKLFGLPYCGGKNSLARDLISLLPSGKRLVDLFGGGGAITHAGAISKKWEKVLYNEINPLTFNAFKNAVNGFFKEEVFGKPPFIDRETFKAKVSTDPYTALCFSFGNDMKTYAYGEDIEGYKKALHNAVVFEEYDSLKNNCGVDLSELSNFKTIKDKVAKLYSVCFKALKNSGKIRKVDGKDLVFGLNGVKDGSLDCCSFIRLQHIERWKRLCSLALTKKLIETVSFTCGSYSDYEYQEGDVVYCDPPYEGTSKDYNSSFDFKSFYDWVASRPYPVYFSSYGISDNRFFKIWERNVFCSLSTVERKTKNEILWSNRKEIEGRTNLLKMFKD